MIKESYQENIRCFLLRQCKRIGASNKCLTWVAWKNASLIYVSNHVCMRPLSDKTQLRTNTIEAEIGKKIDGIIRQAQIRRVRSQKCVW